MTNEEKLETLIERVIKLEMKKVSSDDICRVTNLTTEQLEKIRCTEQFKDGVAIAGEEQINKYDTLNDGWDMIENKGMNAVLTELEKQFPDPDFAMKAARMANQATRRGMHTNSPINPIPNAQVIIHLNGDFSQKLQQSFNVQPRIDSATIAKKDDNFLPPSTVGKLLGSAKMSLATRVEESVDNMLIPVPVNA